MLLLNGTYNIDFAIYIRDYVHLQGQGMYSTVLKGTSTLGWDVIMRDQTSRTPADIRTGPNKPSYGIHLSDFKIDGSVMKTIDPGQETAWGYKATCIKYLQDAIFERVFVYKTPASGLGNDFHRNVVYRDCIAEGCGRMRHIHPEGFMGCSGFGLGMGAWEDEYLVVDRCIARDNAYCGFTFEVVRLSGVPWKYCAIINCIAEGNQQGIEIDTIMNSDNYGASEIRVSGNWVQNNIEDGILLIGGHNGEMIVTENCSTGNGYSGISVRDSIDNQNIVIADNVVTNNWEQGILVYSGGVSALGNQVFGNRLEGILVDANQQAITDVVIQGNRVWNNGVGNSDKDGITLRGSTVYGLERISVIGNQCYDSGGSAMSIAAATRDVNGLCTITTVWQHPYVTGDSVTIAGVAQADFNGTFIVSVTGLKTFTYTQTGSVGSSGSGTATRQPSQRYGISVVGGAAGLSNSFITANMLEGNETDALYLDNTGGSGNLITNNKGYVTDNSGTSTGTGSQETIAHGLSVTPTIVLLSNVDEATNPYQSAAADADNIYITAESSKRYHWLAMVK